MKQMTNLLGLYGGCDSDELRRIRKLPSRWVALCTTFPSIVLYESGCYLLHSDDPAAASGPKAKGRPRLLPSAPQETGVVEKKRLREGSGWPEREDDLGGGGGGGAGGER